MDNFFTKEAAEYLFKNETDDIKVNNLIMKQLKNFCLKQGKNQCDLDDVKKFIGEGKK